MVQDGAAAGFITPRTQFLAPFSTSTFLCSHHFLLLLIGHCWGLNCYHEPPYYTDIIQDICSQTNARKREIYLLESTWGLEVGQFYQFFVLKEFHWIWAHVLQVSVKFLLRTKICLSRSAFLDRTSKEINSIEDTCSTHSPRSGQGLLHLECISSSRI